MRFFPKVLLVPIIVCAIWSCSDSQGNSGDRYFDEGEYELAVQIYTEDLKSKPTDAKILYGRGRAFQEMGNYADAKADFESALTNDPNNFQVLLSLATVQLEEKNYASALLYATRAEEIPGAPASAAFLKGRALHQLGMLEDAMKAYGNAIQLDKDFAQAYFNRGLLKVALKQNNQSCEDFKIASALDYPGADEMLAKYCN
jgi:tetratricopeptide (TPR) repeat protein